MTIIIEWRKLGVGDWHRYTVEYSQDDARRTVCELRKWGHEARIKDEREDR